MEGVIFDFNGTLFWDTPLHQIAWDLEAERLRGRKFNEEEHKNLLGQTNRLLSEYCLGRKITDEENKKYAREKEELYREMCLKDPSVMKLAPGAESLLEYLISNKTAHTIATSSDGDNVSFFIKHFHLAKWFDTDKIVFDQGLFPGKPHPDVYLKAAEVLGLPPSKCIVFEDAVSGVKAAVAAGIGQIYVIANDENFEQMSKLDGVTKAIRNFDEFDRNQIKKN